VIKKQIKEIVKKSYAEIAKTSGSCGCSCSCSSNQSVQRQTKQMGYSQEEMDKAPSGSNLGLGCGNPVAIASLKPGEVVVDLGSGAGFDVFLASPRVGKKGKVIGIDMTDEMLEKARENAKKGGFTNAEFKQGDIEALPLEDNLADVVISNCVINLAPDKKNVFGEIYRVLKPGGRMMVSDTVLTKPLPERIKKDEKMLSACVSGAIMKDEYLKLIEQTGFKDMNIHKEIPGFLEGYSLSITYSAVK